MEAKDLLVGVLTKTLNKTDEEGTYYQSRDNLSSRVLKQIENVPDTSVYRLKK